MNSAQCTLCKFIVDYVEKSIGDNRSTAAIEAALEKVCNILPGPAKNECVTLVDKYGPIISFLLQKNETGEQVCNFIKVCNNGTQEITRGMWSRKKNSSEINNYNFFIFSVAVEDVKKVKSPVGSVECSICKFVVTYVDTVIQSNKSEAAIESALEKVCTIIPHSMNSSCYNFVETYGPVLVQLLEVYVTPDQVCAALKLCKNGTEAVSSECESKFLFQ